MLNDRSSNFQVYTSPIWNVGISCFDLQAVQHLYFPTSIIRMFSPPKYLFRTPAYRNVKSPTSQFLETRVYEFQLFYLPMFRLYKLRVSHPWHFVNTFDLPDSDVSNRVMYNIWIPSFEFHNSQIHCWSPIFRNSFLTFVWLKLNFTSFQSYEKQFV